MLVLPPIPLLIIPIPPLIIPIPPLVDPNPELPPKPEDIPPPLLPNMLLLDMPPPDMPPPDEYWAEAGRPQPSHVNVAMSIATDRIVRIWPPPGEPSSMARTVFLIVSYCRQLFNCYAGP
jgi:hypothetical protein